MITPIQLQKIYGLKSLAKCSVYAPILNRYMPLYGINTPLREASFLAQIGHESGRLVYTEEIASGKAYENRKDLGNIVRGDGARYKGRGLIQITGRANYTEISKDTGKDFVGVPAMLAEPENAVMSACWFWRKRKLNQYADAGDFETLTKRINGGLNGFDDRIKMYELAKKELL